MLPTPQPTIRFESRHHWIWIIRHMRPVLGRYKILFFGVAGLLFLLLFLIGSDIELIIFPGFVFTAWILIEGGNVFWIYMDWKSRNIRLYSDGRLEYEFGVWKREGFTLSMRFGSVKYSNTHWMDKYLNCADVILPHDHLTLEAVPQFRTFWRISLGRI
jgi:hypothetical protein